MVPISTLSEELEKETPINMKVFPLFLPDKDSTIEVGALTEKLYQFEFISTEEAFFDNDNEINEEKQDLYLIAQQFRLRANISEIITIDKDLWCLLVYDVLERSYYRGKVYFYPTTQQLLFTIFQCEKRWFLGIIASKREATEIVKKYFFDWFFEIGIVIIKDVIIPPESIPKIREKFEGELRRSKLSNYPDPSIDSITYEGRGFEKNTRYKIDEKRSKPKYHRFYSMKPDNRERLFEVSLYSVFRCYHSISITSFMKVLKQYFVGSIRLQKRKTVQIPLSYDIEVVKKISTS